MKKFSLAGLLMAMMGAASAQVYVGGAFGPSHVEDCGVYSCDKSDTGYKVYGGYKINPIIAIEAAYIDYGKAKITTIGGGDVSADGFLINAAFRHHATRELSLVGRVGLSMLDAKLRRPLGSTSDSSTKLYFGLGLEYAFTKNLKGTVSADFTSAEVAGEDANVRLISIGAQYDF